jgi:hypothetical protein
MEISEEEPLSLGESETKIEISQNKSKQEINSSKPILGVLENDADIAVVLTELNKQPKELNSCYNGDLPLCTLTYQHSIEALGSHPGALTRSSAITISDDEKIDKELKNKK